MRIAAARALSGVILLGFEHRHAWAYYFEANPQSFAPGDPVKLKVNKMTSQKNLFPVEYYKLPFCVPDGGPQMDNENLGEFLAGDRIESSPYRLKMMTEMYCEQVCITNLGRAEQKGAAPNKVVRAIRKEYHNNWIVDNLSAASKTEDEKYMTTSYHQGFPVGFIDEKTQKAYVNNHVNIEIEVHKVETEADKYRIVRFYIQPFSIAHEFEPADDVDDDKVADGEGEEGPFRVVVITNPIRSCDSRYSKKNHTTYDMVYHTGHSPQVASGKVLFTYDVTWRENKELHWASRWDIYLSMGGFIPAEVHWLSIANSLVIVFVLSAMIAAILVRNLRRDYACNNKLVTDKEKDYAQYNRLATDEEKAEDLEEFGWKLVHADVFRPPTYNPLFMAVCCGTGAQLLCMAVFTIVFAAMGFLSPANRGALLMAQLLLYVLMGSVSGYTTARLYKTFEGKSRNNATTLTALGFPGIAFGVFFVIDMLALTQDSSYAVPFTTIIVLLVLWFGISTPLVFFGAYFGYRQDAIEFPVNTSNIPRQIPDQRWFMGIPFRLLVGGILPFGVCFVELYFIFSSVWMDQYYYVFRFLLLVFLILLVTCAEITVLFTYFQLCGENYHWWWRSFCTSGSTAIYFFIYSFVYFKQLEANGFATYVLYFGYMGLASLGLFLMTGAVGVFSSLWFNKAIFASLKN